MLGAGRRVFELLVRCSDSQWDQDQDQEKKRKALRDRSDTKEAAGIPGDTVDASGIDTGIVTDVNGGPRSALWARGIVLHPGGFKESPDDLSSSSHSSSENATVSTTTRQPVSLQVAEGGILLVTGASGGGKTSLLRALVGIAEPEGGTIGGTAFDCGAYDAGGVRVRGPGHGRGQGLCD